MRLLFRRLWLRGYLPSLMALLLWLASTQVWAYYQAPLAPAPPMPTSTPAASGPPIMRLPFRAACGKGVVMVNWGPLTPHRGVGQVDWNLGPSVDGPRGKFKPGGYVMRQALPPSKWEWDVEIHRGHVKLPLALLAAVLAVPPTITLIVRRTRAKRSPLACPGCGYDLAGLPPGPCPECGRTASPKT